MPKTLATFDLETDPFKHGRIPRPFCAGLYDIENDCYFQWWGKDCVEQFLKYLEGTGSEYILYAHNGGKFDFFYLLEYGVIDPDVKIINGRLVKATVFNGKHEIRDSFSIVPVSLATYQKDGTNYEWFEEENREHFKEEILTYLKSDCYYLSDLVTNFWEMFGDRLTIGGASIKELRRIHPFESISESLDELYRKYYFGGRCQVFEGGIIERPLKYYDVNSMYPYVMANRKHPRGITGYQTKPDQWRKLMDNDEPFFIHFEGTQQNAIPVRTKDGLDFTVERGEFYATSHEFRYGVENGLIQVDYAHELVRFEESITFDGFVNEYRQGKEQAKESGDKVSELFYKLILNSSYGKTGQNPENYYDWQLIGLDDERPGSPWEWDKTTPHYEIWKKPSDRPIYYDVSIAASITGAARTLLLDGICRADGPVYCDTDSIICSNADLPLHKSELGKWDIEAEGDYMAIAGKKLYCLVQKNGEFKTATKGVRLKGDEIIELAKGKEINWQNIAPSFNLGKGIDQATFINRTVKRNV